MRLGTSSRLSTSTTFKSLSLLSTDKGTLGARFVAESVNLKQYSDVNNIIILHLHNTMWYSSLPSSLKTIFS